jgi:RHS repeat-associated protein
MSWWSAGRSFVPTARGVNQQLPPSKELDCFLMQKRPVALQNESDFYPWGGELPFVANDSNHYKFTGKQRDAETQLDYFGARYYSNGLGRWVSPDWSTAPIPVPYADLGDPQSLNLYSYVRNVPTTGIDADGHGCDLCPKVLEKIEELARTKSGTTKSGTDGTFFGVLACRRSLSGCGRR